MALKLLSAVFDLVLSSLLFADACEYHCACGVDLDLSLFLLRLWAKSYSNERAILKMSNQLATKRQFPKNLLLATFAHE